MSLRRCSNCSFWNYITNKYCKACFTEFNDAKYLQSILTERCRKRPLGKKTRKNNYLANFKAIDQKSIKRVFGFINECQQLIPYQFNPYYNIPEIVSYICLQYYYIASYVLIKSPCRIGSREYEKVVNEHKDIRESVVVTIPHKVKGQGIFVYAIVRQNVELNDTLPIEIKRNLRSKLGAFCTPDHLMVVKDVPKTRCDKTLRRILSKIACKEFINLCDATTPKNHDTIHQLIAQRNNMKDK
eukprot:56593_1